ncbi:TonB-dependent receptor [Sapientia aquatica]|uniref:TonB-dependent receptor n=1 Tax=Sapientia aquatica TaxID=1549640 RepID=A0A4R5W4T4_9BURK|nr:TonB-dependent receptor [Sapientia aquatica]TDK68058.1 TonB-dependent receptor [Sapientia aquatica]
MNLLKLSPIAACAMLTVSGALAQTSGEISTVVVTGVINKTGSQTITDNDLLSKKATSSSTGDLLQSIPGMYIYNTGGVSGLPMAHGLGDDRMKVTIDGMDLFPACPNHMNSPLSYIDPTKVDSVTVYTGVSPVSVSSDSLGGAVIVTPLKPQFATAGALLTNGEIGAFYRSNGDASGADAKVTLATDQFSLSYTGSGAKSGDYSAAANFKSAVQYAGGQPNVPTLPLDVVGSTFYKAFNHELAMALMSGTNLLELKVGVQHIPYEGFVNQYMDMLSNKSTQTSLRYEGKFDWGNFDAQVYHQNVDHYMNFGEDRQFLYQSMVSGKYTVAGMPMNTVSNTTGVKAKISKPLSDNALLVSGIDVLQYHLNDWWPPAPDSSAPGGVDPSGMMGPNQYQNIHNGERDVYSAFAEIENRYSEKLSSIIGIRAETVRARTDAITSAYCTSQSSNCMVMYSVPYPYTTNQSRQDNNWNASALFNYLPSAQSSYQFGVSRNAKAPNLYQLYAWTSNEGTGLNMMTAPMNNFIGDGNGYVGNPNLKSEVANKVSLDANWHDADEAVWGVRFSPYFTYVQNYIAGQCAPPSILGNTSDCKTGEYNILEYVNQNARIYGADLSSKVRLGVSPTFGTFSVSNVLSYVRGKNETTGDHLYNMMPLNVKVSLNEKIALWSNTVEIQFVDAKTDISSVQNEVATPGYSLLNLKSTWSDEKYSISFGIDNALNKFYYQPLGGAYMGQGVTMFINGNNTVSAVPGMGRSFYSRLTAKF